MDIDFATKGRIKRIESALRDSSPAEYLQRHEHLPYDAAWFYDKTNDPDLKLKIEQILLLAIEQHGKQYNPNGLLLLLAEQIPENIKSKILELLPGSVARCADDRLNCGILIHNTIATMQSFGDKLPQNFGEIFWSEVRTLIKTAGEKGQLHVLRALLEDVLPGLPKDIHASIPQEIMNAIKVASSADIITEVPRMLYRRVKPLASIGDDYMRLSPGDHYDHDVSYGVLFQRKELAPNAKELKLALLSAMEAQGKLGNTTEIEKMVYGCLITYGGQGRQYEGQGIPYDVLMKAIEVLGKNGKEEPLRAILGSQGIPKWDRYERGDCWKLPEFVVRTARNELLRLAESRTHPRNHKDDIKAVESPRKIVTSPPGTRDGQLRKGTS
jgi:hypothetical protein